MSEIHNPRINTRQLPIDNNDFIIRIAIYFYCISIIIYQVVDIFNRDSIFQSILYVSAIIIALPSIIRLKTTISYPSLLLIISFSIFSIYGLHRGYIEKTWIFLFCSLIVLVIKFHTFRNELFLILSAFIFATIIKQAIEGISIFEVFETGYGRAKTETFLAFTAGILALSGHILRNRPLFWIALGTSVVFSKRIVLFAFLIAYLADIMVRGSRNLRVISTFAFSTISAIIGLFALDFYELVARLLRDIDIGVNIDVLTSGRYEFLTRFDDYLSRRSDLLTTLFGHGMGFTRHALATILTPEEYRRFPHLHDDWLRIFADFGLVGILIIVASFVYLARKSRMGAAIAIYTSVLFVTDNTFAYFYYWFVVAVCLKLVMPETSRKLPAPARRQSLNA